MSLKNLLNKTPFHLALIALLGLAAYSNTFDVPFYFDDRHNIAGNPLIRDLRYFMHPSLADFYLTDAFRNRFVGFLTFALNYKLHGLDVRGYHIFNLTVHILNAMLVYCLILLTFRTPFLTPPPLPSPFSKGGRGGISDEGGGGGGSASFRRNLIALFSALLFVSHPIQTQAVTYIVQRFASLATFFYLLSVVLYIKWRLIPPHPPLAKGGRGGIFFYILSLLSALLAVKTKENAFTLPLMLALCEFVFFEGPRRRRLLYLAPFAGVLLILPFNLIGDRHLWEVMLNPGGMGRLDSAMPRSDYIFTQSRVLLTYMRLLFLPVGQNLDYDYLAYGSFFHPGVFLSFLLHAAFLGLALFMLIGKRNAALRQAAFGTLWFYVTILPESGLVVLPDMIFEHRAYLPSAGAFTAIVSVAFILPSVTGSRRARWISTTALATVVVLLSVAAYARNGLWRDEVRLWEDIVRKSPGKARVHYNLAAALWSRGLVEKAVSHWEATLRLEPDYPGGDEVHYYLGMSHQSGGRTDLAMEHYIIALKLRPDFAEAYLGLGIAYLESGLPEVARRQFEAALAVNPELHEARQYLDYLKRIADKPQ